MFVIGWAGITAQWADLYPGLSTNGYGVYYAITDEQIVIEYAGIKSWSWSCGLAKCWNIKVTTLRIRLLAESCPFRLGMPRSW